MTLHRYWIRFAFTDAERNEHLVGGLLLGCGVTAFSVPDALSLVRRAAFPNGVMPKIEAIIPDVDIRSLDQGHVIPNMSAPNARGVWFPVLKA